MDFQSHKSTNSTCSIRSLAACLNITRTLHAFILFIIMHDSAATLLCHHPGPSSDSNPKTKHQVVSLLISAQQLQILQLHLHPPLRMTCPCLMTLPRLRHHLQWITRKKTLPSCTITTPTLTETPSGLPRTTSRKVCFTFLNHWWAKSPFRHQI